MGTAPKFQVVKASDLYLGARVYNFVLRARVPDNPKLSPIMKGRWRAECQCSQKTVLTLPTWYLTRPQPKTSCGCLRKTSKTLHKRVYSIWTMMRTRCNNPKHEAWEYYGGRGIRVCPEWDNDIDGFDNFLAFMGDPPSPGHTLDRYPDNNSGYRPGNVRWATAAEQRANQNPPGYLKGLKRGDESATESVGSGTKDS